MREENAAGRFPYLDALRLTACFFVVLLHQAAEGFDLFELASPGWHASNLFDSLSRWAVPVFVMISGALFLI